MARKVYKQIAFQSYLSEKVFNGLKDLSKRTRVPMSEYVREAVDYVLKKYKGKKS